MGPVKQFVYLTAALLLIALYAEAITISATEDFSLILSPEFPGPGEKFSARAQSFLFDTVRADFEWFLGGKLISKGLGLTEQEFTAGKAGETMRIKVIAYPQNMSAFTGNVTLPLSDIDLITHPLTYTPPMYRGASLPTPGSQVEVFAVPHLFSGGKRISNQNLIFEWSVDGGKILKQSGGGKNKLVLDIADLGFVENEVSLKVSSVSGSIAAQKSVRIKTVAPEILFYETSELTGKKPLAFSIFNMRSGGTFAIIAEPFFMALESLKIAKINWRVGGADLETTPENPRLLELAAPAGEQSESSFSLLIEDVKKIFQRVEAKLRVVAQP